MTNVKKKDDELPHLIIATAIFTIGLVCVDIWYSDWHTMFHSKDIYAMFGPISVMLHLTIAVGWVFVVAKWKDPNFDPLRKILIGVIVATIIIVAGFKAANNEGKMFQDDVDKAKQDQSK